MRNMSFSHTTAQILDRSKTVTRRDGWTFLKPGDRLRAVRKAMGLRKGEKVEQLAVIEVVSVRREVLGNIDRADCAAEGFPEKTPVQFMEMFAEINKYPTCPMCGKRHGCVELGEQEVTRIEFRYVDENEVRRGE